MKSHAAIKILAGIAWINIQLGRKGYSETWIQSLLAERRALEIKWAAEYIQQFVVEWSDNQ